ncbi:unnamed protein product [Brachionus calyciflorus]|uniref:MULE transposase domain-containing protein n=1 Tax=Brachionus calyciflorus TaxID=104777 RepID=A0A814LS63_9BILA|nr:unnamed protein product [Brachionus calyciflorus]
MSNDLILIDRNIENEKNTVNSHSIAYFQYHTYRWREDNSDGTTRYYCTNKTNFKCTACIKTRGEVFICQTGLHFGNKMDDLDVKCLIAEQDLKKMVMGDLSKSIKECYNTIQSDLLKKDISADVVAAKFPSFAKISSTLQKRRRNKQPEVPKDFHNLTITGEYEKTIQGTLFLQYDNKSENKRVMIFVDDATLKILAQAKLWLMDGTFKSAPKKLLQLYTTHAFIEKITIPCCYILTQDKDEKTYRDVFGKLKDIAIERNILLSPKSVMTDFEKASTNAFVYHFHDVELKGCWFHFRQAINRNAGLYGLKQHFREHEYKRFINSLGSLALVSLNLVQDGFNYVRNIMPNDPKCLQLYDYFERQWIKIWNHNDTDVRTNNYVEGFNSALNQQQSNAIVDYSRIKQSQTVRLKSNKEQEKPLTLELIKIDNKNCRNVAEYLSSLWHYVQFPYEIEIVEFPELITCNFQANERQLSTEQPITTSENSTEQPITIQPKIYFLILADVMEEINLDQDSDDESFNYLVSIANREGLNRMYAERAAERTEKEQAINERVNSITSTDIDEEVKKIW